MVLLYLGGAAVSFMFVSVFADVLGFGALTIRARVAIAFLFHEAVTVAITELASIHHHYDAATVAVALAVATVGMLTAVVIRLTTRGYPWPAPGPSGGRLPQLALDFTVVGVVLAGMVLIECVLAVTYRPSNMDSMAYHLPRVEEWIQNRSVGSFATHYTPQLENAPLHDYNLAVLHLLARTDRFDGLVQVAAVVVCACAASELARRLGLGPRGQLFTAVLVATVPNIVLEAASTTDSAFSAAIGASAIVVITSPVPDQMWARRGIALGTVAGLAEIAKGTVYPMLGPLVVVLLAIGVARLRTGGGWARVARLSGRMTAFAVIPALLVAGPFLARNLAVFGGLGGPNTRILVAEDPGLASGTGTMLRTTAAQFQIGDGTGPISEFGQVIVTVCAGLFDLLGQGLFDKSYVSTPQNPFSSGDFSTLNRFEDVGANPWHTLLIGITLLSLVYLVLVRRRRDLRLALALALGLAAGFWAFSTFSKWQIYGSRLHEPLLVLWAPLTALVFQRLPPNWELRVRGRVLVDVRPRTWITRMTAIALIAACIPQYLDNYTRPLVGMDVPPANSLRPYFIGYSDAEVRARDYEDLSHRIATSDCHLVGIGNWLPLEYPLWVGLRRAGWRGTIVHVAVRNPSRELLAPDLKPCALVYNAEQSHVMSTDDTMTRHDYGTLLLFLDKGSGSN